MLSLGCAPILRACIEAELAGARAACGLQQSAQVQDRGPIRFPSTIHHPEARLGRSGSGSRAQLTEARRLLPALANSASEAQTGGPDRPGRTRPRFLLELASVLLLFTLCGIAACKSEDEKRQETRVPNVIKLYAKNDARACDHMTRKTLQAFFALEDKGQDLRKECPRLLMETPGFYGDRVLNVKAVEVHGREATARVEVVGFRRVCEQVTRWNEPVGDPDCHTEHQAADVYFVRHGSNWMIDTESTP